MTEVDPIKRAAGRALAVGTNANGSMRVTIELLAAMQGELLTIAVGGETNPIIMDAISAVQEIKTALEVGVASLTIHSTRIIAYRDAL